MQNNNKTIRNQVVRLNFFIIFSFFMYVLQLWATGNHVYIFMACSATTVYLHISCVFAMKTGAVQNYYVHYVVGHLLISRGSPPAVLSSSARI